MEFDYKSIVNEVCSKNFWSRMLVMLISVFIMTINYNTFLLPNNLVIGGVSGIAIIVNKTIGLDPAILVFVLNIILIIVSFIFLGTRTTGLTIIGSIVFPIFISLTAPIGAKLSSILVFDNFIIVAIISGLLFGISNGFVFKTGYSTGGTDIIIQLINKYLKIPTGVSSVLVSLSIIGAGAIFFGLNCAVYSIIIEVITGLLVDKILLGISDSKMFYIHTDKPEEIKAFLTELENGYTIMKAEGGHNRKKNDLIMCVVPTKDYYMFKNVVTKIDPGAFFVISDCYEVYGGKRKATFPFI